MGFDKVVKAFEASGAGDYAAGFMRGRTLNNVCDPGRAQNTTPGR